MNDSDFQEYLRGLGLTVESAQDSDGVHYTVIRNVGITSGSLRGRTCDVATAYCTSQPYVVPSAVHVRPALIPMGTLATQASRLGDDWQYWSRRFDHPPSPQRLWAHIMTVLTEV
jgi:hypothetical protein